MDNKIKVTNKIKKVKDSLEKLNKVISDQKVNVSPELEESFNLISEEYIDNITNIIDSLEIKPKKIEKPKVIHLMRNGQWF